MVGKVTVENEEAGETVSVHLVDTDEGRFKMLTDVEGNRVIQVYELQSFKRVSLYDQNTFITKCANICLHVLQNWYAKILNC